MHHLQHRPANLIRFLMIHERFQVASPSCQITAFPPSSI